MASKKICPRCKRLIDISLNYCEKCTIEKDRLNKNRHKEYKRRRNDEDIQAIYKSTQWEQVRETVKTYQKGLCLYSFYILNIIKEADKYHHIIETKDDISKAFDIENIIGLTNSIHEFVHAEYRKGEEAKGRMQRLLSDLIKKWNQEYRGVNG